MDAKLTDQYQNEKWKAAQIYRVRLSGMVSGQHVRKIAGPLTTRIFPEFVTEPNPFDSQSTFGGTLPPVSNKIAGVWPRTSGRSHFGRHRFRLCGRIPLCAEWNRIDSAAVPHRDVSVWTGKKTSVVAGTGFPVFSLRCSRTSLASVAIPALSYSGNLWGWTPQIRIEHRIDFSENVSPFYFRPEFLIRLPATVPFFAIRPIPFVGRAIRPAGVCRPNRVEPSHISGRNMTFGEGALLWPAILVVY